MKNHRRKHYFKLELGEMGVNIGQQLKGTHGIS